MSDLTAKMHWIQFRMALRPGPHCQSSHRSQTL